MADARANGGAATGKASLAKPDIYNRLLQEAARLFRQHGYEGTSTRAIASAVGLQSASLYHYMENKEDLLHRICLDGWARMAGVMEQALELPAAPMDALKWAIREHLRTGLEHRDVYLTMLAESRALSARSRVDVMATRERYLASVSALIRRAQEDGSLRDDVAVAELALIVRNLLVWTMFWYRADGELDFDGLCTLLIKILLQGAYGARSAG